MYSEKVVYCKPYETVLHVNAEENTFRNLCSLHSFLLKYYCVFPGTFSKNYAGCFIIDKANSSCHGLPMTHYPSEKMTIQRCIDYCSQLAYYTFYGTLHHNDTAVRMSKLHQITSVHRFTKLVNIPVERIRLLEAVCLLLGKGRRARLLQRCGLSLLSSTPKK